MATPSDFGELIQLPNGERLYYRDPDHSYWRCNEDASRGRRLTNVSTIVQNYSGSPDGLMNWAARMALEGVVLGFQDEPIPHSLDSLHERLDDLELTWKHLRDQAGERGDLAHEWLEALAGARDYPSMEDASDTEKAIIAGINDWWDRNQPDVLQAEQIVYSGAFGYAGRFDLRFRRGDKIVLLDLKTSAYIAVRYAVQLVGYDLAAHECGIGRSDELVILRVTADDGPQEFVSEATDEDFVKALMQYRRGNELQRGLLRQRDHAHA
jgi:hypothetical protein